MNAKNAINQQRRRLYSVLEDKADLRDSKVMEESAKLDAMIVDWYREDLRKNVDEKKPSDISEDQTQDSCPDDAENEQKSD